MKITKENFELIAKSLGYKVIAEYKFLTDRKFRADWLVNDKILIEYEGIKGKSRHTSITGYSNDCEKYNLAQIHGFVVMRYTILNFDNVFNDLEKNNSK